MVRIRPFAFKTICTSFLLFSYSLVSAQNYVATHDAPEIVFTKSSQTLGNTMTFGFAIADVDLDGDNDIFIANYSDVDASRLWINNGHGNFTLHNQSFSPGAPAAHDVDLADLNGDLYPDIFLANHNGTSQIYFSNGNGSYILGSQTIGTVNDHPQTIQLTDVDGDGDMDAFLDNTAAANRIWLNDGSGLFTMRNIDYGGSDSNRQFLADFNNDSFPDLFISMRTGASQIWMNDGAGNMANSDQGLPVSGDAIDCQDIDGDGDKDLVVAHYAETTILLNQNNTGNFLTSFNLGEGAIRCKLFDADLDGDYDLVTTHVENGNKLWLNDGIGLFTFYSTVFPGKTAYSLECMDLDGDNDIDVVLGQEPDTGGNSIYFNETIQTGIGDNKPSAPLNFNLLNNYPNPFNPFTSINYSIPQNGFVSLIVYDITGREITRIVNNNMPAGAHKVEFDGSNLANGVYVYQLISGKKSETKKMLLLK
ncbi:MAG TPA: T9SS type A sorting domain-containing protein [bacterium]|nr:T9SS type A sorting domain-containing protein [bacterium]HPN44395.1 T9SS type A sorting domain-containing protein [bacterium]